MEMLHLNWEFGVYETFTLAYFVFKLCRLFSSVAIESRESSLYMYAGSEGCMNRRLRTLL